MSDQERDAQSEDRRLRALLDSWKAPDPSQSLDKRIVGAYQRKLKAGAFSPINSMILDRNSEVAKMKQCAVCREEFADKFAFCPVDGTPLNPVVIKNVEPPHAEHEYVVPSPSVVGELFDDYPTIGATSAASSAVADDGFSAAGAVEPRPEFHLTIIEDAGLTQRLIKQLKEVGHESQLTWPEFKRDPVGFTRRSAAAYGTLTWKFFKSPNVAIGTVTAVFLVVTAVIALFAFDSYRTRKQRELAAKEESDLALVDMVDIPADQPKPDKGTAGMAKGNGGGSKPKQEKAGGGGGGGREEQKPASFGKLPQTSLTVPQVVAPDPHPPKIKNPSLPVAASLDADPLLFPPDKRPISYGDPKSKSTDTSSGSGKGNGIGTGNGGGVGPGEGGGYGPGRGGNTGGGDRNEGGGGPGGGGGGGPDPNKVYRGNEVNAKARILSKPEPQYTEEARKNQTSGTVVIKAVFASSGQVTSITALRRLPDGLTEKAIAAARQIKFVPATKDGRPVSMYMQIEYSFNLY